MSALLQLFNEMILPPTAVIVDVIIRSVRALYFGFGAAFVELGIDPSLSSVISGFIVIILLLGFFWFGALIIRKLQVKNPSQSLVWIGTIAFLLGCAVGVYFLGLTFYALAQADFPPRVITFFAGGIILYPFLGFLVRQILGRNVPTR